MTDYEKAVLTKLNQVYTRIYYAQIERIVVCVLKCGDEVQAPRVFGYSPQMEREDDKLEEMTVAEQEAARAHAIAQIRPYAEAALAADAQIAHLGKVDKELQDAKTAVVEAQNTVNAGQQSVDDTSVAVAAAMEAVATVDDTDTEGTEQARVALKAAEAEFFDAEKRLSVAEAALKAAQERVPPLEEPFEEAKALADAALAQMEALRPQAPSSA